MSSKSAKRARLDLSAKAVEADFDDKLNLPRNARARDPLLLDARIERLKEATHAQRRKHADRVIIQAFRYAEALDADATLKRRCRSR